MHFYYTLKIPRICPKRKKSLKNWIENHFIYDFYDQVAVISKTNSESGESIFSEGNVINKEYTKYC